MLKIEKTTQYDQFKFTEKNRDINPLRVRDLVEQIQIKNLLETNPISVNEDMVVIDGQHRLKAAEKLEIPIYYIVDNNLDETDLITLNNNRTSWDYDAYLKYYMAQGNENYKNVFEFSKRIGKSFNHALGFITWGGYQYEMFKKGTFKFTEQDLERFYDDYLKIDEVVQLINNLLPTEKRIFTKHKMFQKGLMRLFLLDDFIYTYFLKKLPRLLGKLRPCGGSSEYFDMFLMIYNHFNQSKIGE